MWKTRGRSHVVKSSITDNKFSVGSRPGSGDDCPRPNAVRHSSEQGNIWLMFTVTVLHLKLLHLSVANEVICLGVILDNELT